MKDQIPEEYKKTVKSALNMLAYSECTANHLEKKLLAKGYTTESVEYALEYVIKRGYLNEARYLERLFEQLAYSKLYGPHRIAVEVYKKGFSLSLVRVNLVEHLKDVDFSENCIKLARKNFRSDKNKLFEYLVRAGYSAGDASNAVKTVFSEHPEADGYDDNDM